MHYKLGRAYVEAADLAAAYGSFSTAADLDASFADAQVQAGQLLLVTGDFERAKTRADAAIAADPRSVAARILLGNALAGLNDTTQAMKQMQEAVALDPDVGARARGARVGAVRRAQSLRARLLRAGGGAAAPSVESRLALANFDWETGDHAAAERDLQGALRVDPASADAHRALALLYVSDKRPLEAEPHFKALANQSAEGSLALADYYAGVGRPDEALPHSRFARHAIRRSARVARMRTAATLRQQGRRAEAIAIADALVKERPSDADAHSLKARLLLSDPADPAGAWAEAAKR